jgi:hypothetical protein
MKQLHNTRLVSRHSRAATARFRPRLERLEDRQAPAIFNVTSLSDSTAENDGSLRGALVASNFNGGPNEIDILAPGLYRLTVNGFLAVLNKSVSILNKSGGAVVIDGSGRSLPDSVFEVSPVGAAINVTIQGVTIQGGNVVGSGGGILLGNGSTLTLNNDVIQDNEATGSGGGVFVGSGTLNINNCVIQNNVSEEFGGGVTMDLLGAALNVNGSTISNNVANSAGGGLSIINASAATLAVQNSIISNNSLTTNNFGGGGIFVHSTGNATITNCAISGNTSLAGGGGVEDALSGNHLSIIGSTISSNHAFGGEGGGIDYAVNGIIRLDASVVSGNTASGDGGGLAVSNANATVNNVMNDIISGNRAGGSGGGIAVAGVSLFAFDSTIAGNFATGSGGGIEARTTGGLTNLSEVGNLTLAGNRCGGNGGGIDAPGLFSGELIVANDTINANLANNGGGIFYAGTLSSQFVLQSTIVAQNSATAGPDADNPAGSFTDDDGNLIGISGTGSGNSGFTAPHTQIGTTAAPLDPKLGALQNNGGPTAGAPGSPITLPTEALLIGSPAHDRGVTNLFTDERGVSRSDTLVPESPDVGAFESTDSPADPSRYPLTFHLGHSASFVNLTANGAVVGSANPFPGFSGEIHRATGDVNRDDTPDMIWAEGPGGCEVVISDGKTGTKLVSFFAFNPSFGGGVSVAAGDVNGDGVADIIVGAGPGGGPEVKIIDGTKVNVLQANGEIGAPALLGDFFAFAPGFTGGVNVAAGDINADKRADVIASVGPGGGPEVRVVDATKLRQVQPNGQIAPSALLADFFAYAPNFTGGVYISAGDFNGDGHADIVTGPGAGGGPEVKVIDGTKAISLQGNGEIADASLLADFMAYDASFLGGVRVAAVDVNGDGLADIVTGAGPGGSPHVKVFRAKDLALLASFLAAEPTYTGGVFVG